MMMMHACSQKGVNTKQKHLQLSNLSTLFMPQDPLTIDTRLQTILSLTFFTRSLSSSLNITFTHSHSHTLSLTLDSKANPI